MSVVVNVVGQSAVSVSVAASTSVSVVASGGIGPAGFLTVPGTSTQAFGTFQLQAGNGITVSTTDGQFLISSYASTSVSSLAPVQSVAGRTGTVVLVASDVTSGTFAVGRIPTIGYTALSGVPVEFAPASHTHDAAAISSGTLSIARVPTISYTALSNTPATFTPSAHTHSTTDIVAFTASASAAAPVQSVQSRTGAVVLTRADITAAAEVHTHSTAYIVGLTAAFSQVGHTHDAAAVTSGVLDIGRVPTIGYTALSGVPATFAPSTHTHSTTDIVGLTASFSQPGHTHNASDVTAGVLDIARIPVIAYTALAGIPDSFGPGFHTHHTTDIVAFTASASAAAPVQSVAGRTGAISLAAVDVSGLAGVATSGSYTSLNNVPATFAPSSHTHSTTEVVGLTASFAQIGHTHSTGDIVGYQSLPAQAGSFGPLVTDGTNVAFTSRFSIVNPVLVQGAGMSFTRDTSAGEITIAFAGGTSGLAVGSLAPLALGVAAAGSSSNASREDHVHKLPTVIDITAAAASHTHDAAAVTSGVLEIGRIPTVGYTALSGVPVTFAPSTHTHDAAAIASGTIDAARLPANVSALNALTGGITIAGGANVTVSTASSTITIAAGGGGGSSAVRTFAVTNSGSGAYLIDGASNPTLTLERGQTYDLAINAAGHPFHFQTVAPPYSSGNLYTTGVTNSGTASGTIRIVVPYDAPSTLYYVCQYHGSMGGAINVVNANEDSVLRALFAPPAPTGVTATAGNAQAVVSWTAPTVLAQTPITDYVVQFSTNSGSTYTTFSDGTSTATTATVTGLTNGTATLFRVAAVNALGTGAFSTASAAVTPVAGDALFASVALLLPMDGTGATFIDSSAVPKTITAYGNATQSTAQSKWGGKSLYLDGSGDYLAAASVPAFGTSDFVIEMWIWFNSITNAYTGLYDARPGINGNYPAILLNGTALCQYLGSNFVINGATPPTGQWNHVALARASGSTRLYLNGTQTGSTYTDSTNYLAGALLIGQGSGGDFSVNGYIDDLRVTIGSDRGYTGATITVPTAAFPTRGIYEDPFFESVSLILPMDGTGATFLDSSLAPKAITAYGNATQSTAQSKWGGKSAYFDGDGDYLSATGELSQFGTSDFVVEFWLYYIGTGLQYSILDTRSSNSGFVIYKAPGDTLNVYTSSNIITGSVISENTWHYIALARSGSNMRLFLNGTQTGSTFSTLQNYADQLLTVGTDFPRNARWTQGYIDDIRITKGSARGYTGATITVPTAAFPTS